ncbi:permease [Blastococcus montanus]|uniref:permease n=1 Tax=Blastococcus montanus TaxID=3144973 RepID=UPI003208A14D
MSDVIALPESRPARRTAVAGVLIAVALFAAGLLWSKWLPYGAKLGELGASNTWVGSSILTVGGVQPGDAPSWNAATTFAWTYGQAVWKALLTALVIAAAVQALVPRAWLLRVLNRRTQLGAAAVGGLVSAPSMMCTCCSAPVAVTLRRSGVSTAAAVAYWLGNPLLNPAVLAFLVLVAPWQWASTRLVVALFVVIGGAAVVGWLVEGRRVPTADVPEVLRLSAAENPVDDAWLVGAPARFGRALLKLGIVLVPEYLVVVFLLGAFRGWLFQVDALGAGLFAIVVAAIIGTLMVIPTAGEIPILHGLVLAGLAAGPVGALLVTLPAVSIPGIAMVARAFGWRATLATTAVVVAGGIAAAGMLVGLA